MKSGSPFSFMFKDSSWFIKLLAGIGFFFVSAIASGIVQNILRGANIEAIPLIGSLIVSAAGSIITSAIINGYQIDLVHNIVHGREVPLPKWLDNFGDKIKNGALLSVIEFIWGLPASILGIVAGLSAGGFTQFNGLTPEVTVDNLNPAAGILLILAGLWGLFLLLILPIVIARFASTRQFASAFEFGPIFSILGRNIGKYVIVVLLEILAVIVAFLGIIGLGIGIIFTIAYVAVFVLPGIWGFAYLDALENMDEPLPERGPMPPTTPSPPYQPMRPSQPRETTPFGEPLPPAGQTPAGETPVERPVDTTPEDTAPANEAVPPGETAPPMGKISPDDQIPPNEKDPNA